MYPLPGELIGTNDRERDVVPDAGLRLGGEHIAGGSFEEFQHSLVFERRRIGKVHDHLRSG
jgi:hypothetical protein